MRGLVLFAQRPYQGRSYVAERPGAPAYWVSDSGGTPRPVHEVWFWDRELRLWFVMTAEPARRTDLGWRQVGFPCGLSIAQLSDFREQWRSYLCSRPPSS